MRGWETMSSTCVQSGMLPRGLSAGYEVPHLLEARSPAPAWHLHHNLQPVVKQEPVDQDSSAYGSGSDGFHSSSPGGSDHHSRDSDPPSKNYTSTQMTDATMQMSSFYSSPISSRMPVSAATYQHIMSSFNPLTPPGFDPMISPKDTAAKPEKNTFQHIERDQNATLTPCTTPPSEDTPPKSPKGTPTSDEGDYYGKPESEDHLRRLQMAFEKNGMLPESPNLDNRDSGDDDAKSDYEDEMDEQGLRIPRVNAHGKVKTFKCKQCDFVAVTKLDFWEHSRAHIKAEKLLTCPKCPFVTEYKHHLEYHLRNHFGSKPFKCDKCSYSCVNKSMLNSHLKSHSNIYQYRCADCTYATKYCHSLKLHLRKYKHSPAMVLNPDGSPNPLPIIDVYGTRRGPKQKSSKNEEPLMQHSPPHILPKAPMFPPFMVPNKQLPLPFPYGPLLGAFPTNLTNPLMFPPMNNGNISPNPSNGRSTPESLKEDEQQPEEIRPPSPPIPSVQTEENSALDLTKPEAPLSVPQPEAPQQTPVVASKNRRKGKAFKLERMPVDDQESTEEDDEKKMEVVEELPAVSTEPAKDAKKDIFNCQYCDIDFRDVVMYTMHMGYHGYKDPFTCNMCGEQSVDKVSFFLHIARTSHS